MCCGRQKRWIRPISQSQQNSQLRPEGIFIHAFNKYLCIYIYIQITQGCLPWKWVEFIGHCQVPNIPRIGVTQRSQVSAHEWLSRALEGWEDSTETPITEIEKPRDLWVCAIKTRWGRGKVTIVWISGHLSNLFGSFDILAGVGVFIE